MGRTLDLSGGRLSLALSAVQVAALLSALLYVALPLDSPGQVLLAVLFSLVVAATAVGWWRSRGDGDGGDDGGSKHLGTAEDITYDPVADPGQAAKDRWKKAVRRLPGRDDEQD